MDRRAQEHDRVAGIAWFWDRSRRGLIPNRERGTNVVGRCAGLIGAKKIGRIATCRMLVCGTSFPFPASDHFPARAGLRPPHAIQRHAAFSFFALSRGVNPAFARNRQAQGGDDD